jgi:hypothetical protein
MPWPPSSSASSTSPRSSTGSTSCPTNSQVRARKAQLQELHQFPNRPAGSTLSGVDAAPTPTCNPALGWSGQLTAWPRCLRRDPRRGWLAGRARTGRVHDRMRGRIIFPIHDAQGSARGSLAG